MCQIFVVEPIEGKLFELFSSYTYYSYSQNILLSYQAPDPVTKPSKEDLCLDSSLNASDLSLELTSEPSNESADWTGSSVENSEEIRE